MSFSLDFCLNEVVKWLVISEYFCSSANDMGAMPMARMEFASFCLDNALLCLDTSTKIPFDTAATAHCPPSKQDNNDARLVVCCWLDSLFWFLAVVQILESGFVYLLNSIDV